ncbi:MAG: excisionase [archaeon]|nr:excisionase [archaeon]
MGKFTLMHKDVPVVDLDFDLLRGRILTLGKVHGPSHLPTGSTIGNVPDFDHMCEWWNERCIPVTRIGLQNLLDCLDVPSIANLVIDSLGLSLSDHYWICPKDAQIQYSEIDLFQNEYSTHIGNVLFGCDMPETICTYSPDITTDGNLMKRWKNINGKHCLLKAGTGMNSQEPFNEMIASILMDSLSIDHVDYSISKEAGRIVCCCEDFVDLDKELIPAKRLIDIKTPDAYHQYITSCDKLGIDIVPALDRMIAIDYIIGNEDRHLGNFGLIRNPDTLEYISAAPIFDCGSSLGYNRMNYDLGPDMVVPCKPFSGDHEKQRELITDLSWLKSEALSEGIEKVEQFLAENEMYISTERADALLSFIRKRSDTLLAHH